MNRAPAAVREKSTHGGTWTATPSIAATIVGLAKYTIPVVIWMAPTMINVLRCNRMAATSSRGWLRF